MDNTNRTYQFFDTQSPRIHGVDTKTGKFHTYIPIASLVGNEGRGPALDLELFYSPDLFDHLFGNWSLRFSHFTAGITGVPEYDPQDIPDTLYLSNGEAWQTTKKISSPTFKFADEKQETIIRKDGIREQLTSFSYTIKGQSNLPEDTEAWCKLPKKIISPTGLSLTLEWECEEDYPPRLKSIKDEKQTLVNVTYTEAKNAEEHDVAAFRIYPGTKEEQLYQFKIIGEAARLRWGEPSVFRCMIEASLPDSPAPTTFENTELKLKSISHSSGLKDEIAYHADGKVSCHTSSLGDAQVRKSDYSYKDSTTTQTDMVGDATVTSTFHYDSDNAQIKEARNQGNCTHTILQTHNYDEEQKVLISTTEHTYEEDDNIRTETSSSTVDAFANLISHSENGVTTDWTYYRGAYKEEHTVTTKTYTNASGIIGIIGWIGDTLTVAGWLNRAFNKQGLSWGTVEDHTITRSPYLTDTGKTEYNLPTKIICPGDPNYFRVYPEAERVYTYRDGKRVDLKWTFFGYSACPVKDPSLAGPAVKPSVKLTILDPITDDYKKLKSWRDGSMTLETIEYYTDSKDPVTFDRIKSITQIILDAKGGEVPSSKQTTEMQYALADGYLTTTSSVKIAGCTPAVTRQKIKANTAQLHESIDSLGNRTSYRYDSAGRLVSSSEFDQNPELRNETTYDYECKDNLQCMTTHFSSGARYREERDGLGRIVNTKAHHKDKDGEQWLTLSNTRYDLLGRETLTTEYDYRPDGEFLLERKLETTYDDWGQPSRVQLEGGAAVCFEHDPIARTSAQWREWGNHSSGVRTQITEDPKIGQQREEETFSNDTTIVKTTATYDAWGRLSKEAPSVGPTRQYEYDHFGRMTQMTSADVVRCNTYPAHTPAPTILSAQIAKPQNYTFGSRKIDGLGRVTEMSIGGRKQTYTYEGASPLGEGDLKPSNIFQPQETPSVESSYDRETGRLNEKVSGFPYVTPAQTYSVHSLRGLLLESQDAFGNTTQYQYNSLGQLTGSTNEKVETSFSYDDNGSLSVETVTDLDSERSATITYTYDEQLRESERRVDVEDFPSLTIKRTYEKGWLASTEMLKDDEQLRLEKFSYTPEGRLANYQCSGNHKPVDPQGKTLVEQAFTYNGLGNLTQCISTFEEGENTTDFVYDTTDHTQLKSVTHSSDDYPDVTFTYDELGRLKSDDAGNSLKYNQSSRLSELKKNNPDSYANYRYDTLGRLAGCLSSSRDAADHAEQYYLKGGRHYAEKAQLKLDGKRHDRTLVLLNDSNACVLQLQKLQPEDEWAVYSKSFEIKDANNSLVASYNLDDMTQSFFAYTPFGYRPDDYRKPNWLGFNGQPIDRFSGTYHLGNGYRVYDPVLQRFQAPDNLSPFDGGGLNAYNYCSNNPINFADPSGHTEVYQHSVVTHQPWMQPLYDPMLDALIMGGLGIALAPLTGGASAVWTAAAVGMASASAAFAVGSVALAESDPELARALGWASLATGIGSAGVGMASAGARMIGARLAARGSRFAASAGEAGISSVARGAADGRRLVTMGGTMRSLKQVDGELYTFVDTYKGVNRLNVAVHGKDLSLLERAMSKSSSVILNDIEHSASDLLNLLTKKGIDPNVYANVRLLICYSGNGGATSFAAQFRQLVRPSVKGYVGPVTMNFGSTPMAANFAKATQLYGPQGEQAMAAIYANKVHTVAKTNPYSLLKPDEMEKYLFFRYAPIHFP